MYHWCLKLKLAEFLTPRNDRPSALFNPMEKRAFRQRLKVTGSPDLIAKETGGRHGRRVKALPLR
jgi:hypothetical protein